MASVDSGSADGVPPQRLTLTFGFGRGLFTKDDKDQYRLAQRLPDALADLPLFHCDQLDPARCGGDLSVQACADDPQVVFNAMRVLGQIA